MIGLNRSPFKEILKHLKNWNPSKGNSHNGYENLLKKYLESNIKSPVKKEYTIGEMKSDICIPKFKIAIEIKTKFKSKKQKRVLRDEIRDYRKYYDFLVVVILDHIREDYYRELKEEYEKNKAGLDFGSKLAPVRIIRKDEEGAEGKNNGSAFRGNNSGDIFGDLKF